MNALFVAFTLVFFFKQKTAYERRISDWSSDVCSSDLDQVEARKVARIGPHAWFDRQSGRGQRRRLARERRPPMLAIIRRRDEDRDARLKGHGGDFRGGRERRPYPAPCAATRAGARRPRSEEHTSELQSLMRISYAVFCLKKKKKHA